MSCTKLSSLPNIYFKYVNRTFACSMRKLTTHRLRLGRKTPDLLLKSLGHDRHYRSQTFHPALWRSSLQRHIHIHHHAFFLVNVDAYFFYPIGTSTFTRWWESSAFKMISARYLFKSLVNVVLMSHLFFRFASRTPRTFVVHTRFQQFTKSLSRSFCSPSQGSTYTWCLL